MVMSTNGFEKRTITRPGDRGDFGWFLSGEGDFEWIP